MIHKLRTKALAFFFFIALFTPAFAQQTPTTALEMNNYFSSIIDSLYTKGYAWGLALHSADSLGNYAPMAALRKDLESSIDKYVKDLSNQKDIGGSEDFRKAMIEFLHFERNLITNCFKPFEALTASSTQQDKDKLQAKLELDSKDEDAKLEKIRKVQNDYADKNGFVIQH